MSLFVCDICGAIENTALGWYWQKDIKTWRWKDAAKNGKGLCSECTPTEFADGSLNDMGGTWHGQFPKRVATETLLLEIGLKNFTYLGKFEYLRTRQT